MSNTIVLKKGLNLPVKGEPQARVSKAIVPETVAVQPTDFKGLLPRLLVKEGDRVLCGSPVLADKKNMEILIASPVSGTVKEILRGDKRKLLAVLIQSDDEQETVDFGKKAIDKMDAGEVKSALLASGLWPFIVQRPYGIIADPKAQPKGIFASAFNTAPLAGDLEFTLGNEAGFIQAGIEALAKIAPVHIGVNDSDSAFSKLKDCTVHCFSAKKHPAGNVGVQISHISPIRKEETVWTVSLLGLATIGKLFKTGRYCPRRKVAVGGPQAIEPSYVETVPGTPVKELKSFYGADAEGKRFVSGDILSGENVGENGFIRFQDEQFTIIKEGNEKEYFGWIRPLRYKQFSTDHCYFSWLTPKRKYDMDTNLHGGPRAFIMNDAYYGKVLPMDIFPLYLTKACLALDIDKMEKFGIYEVLPEDLALCEFVDPSKNYIQDIIAQGIDLMLKEMA